MEIVSVFIVISAIVILVSILLIAAKIGLIAESKGRSYKTFFWLSLLFSPLIMWILVATMATDTASISSSNSLPGLKKCPDCAEFVKIEAVKCKHCGSQI